jgi:hypothetical protein
MSKWRGRDQGKVLKWCGGDAFANGFAYFTWTGEDEYGNPITLEEKVQLLP